MQHERVFVFARDRVNDLCIATGTQCRSNDRLRLTTSENGGTVCARQYANIYVDRAYRGLVAAIDARLTETSEFYPYPTNSFWVESSDLNSQIVRWQLQCHFDRHP